MSTIRVCTYKQQLCSCDEAAMQPCLARLTAACLRLELEGSEDPDEYGDFLLHRHILRRQIEDLHRSYPDWVAALKRIVGGLSL